MFNRNTASIVGTVDMLVFVSETYSCVGDLQLCRRPTVVSETYSCVGDLPLDPLKVQSSNIHQCMKNVHIVECAHCGMCSLKPNYLVI